jgi:hypothetical protein
VAVGRDYADVPPTRGVFKGSSAVRSELAVAVRIGSLNGSAGDDAIPFMPWMSREAASPLGEWEASQQQQVTAARRFKDPSRDWAAHQALGGVSFSVQLVSVQLSNFNCADG